MSCTAKSMLSIIGGPKNASAPVSGITEPMTSSKSSAAGSGGSSASTVVVGATAASVEVGALSPSSSFPHADATSASTESTANRHSQAVLCMGDPFQKSRYNKRRSTMSIGATMPV